jgi:micrococcal nuclease
VIRLVIFIALGLWLISCGEQVLERGLAAKDDTSSAKIVRVVDGDTIKVEVEGEEKSVRLIGVDTPESRKPGVKVECGAKQASANLERLAPVGAKAKLTYDASQDKVDHYGRLIAYVSVKGRLLQREQIYDGWSATYVYDGKPFEKVDSFRRAEEVAKGAGRGVWGQCSGDFHSEQP